MGLNEFYESWLCIVCSCMFCLQLAWSNLFSWFVQVDFILNSYLSTCISFILELSSSCFFCESRHVLKVWYISLQNQEFDGFYPISLYKLNGASFFKINIRPFLLTIKVVFENLVQKPQNLKTWFLALHAKIQ